MMIYSAIIFTLLPILFVAHLIDCLRRGKAYGSTWPTRWGQPVLYWTSVAAQFVLLLASTAITLLVYLLVAT